MLATRSSTTCFRCQNACPTSTAASPAKVYLAPLRPPRLCVNQVPQLSRRAWLLDFADQTHLSYSLLITKENDMERKTADQYPQELLDLFHEYQHGDMDRRSFLDRAAKFAVGGLTVA